ncbi:Cytochrome c oxidase subunit 3 [Candidatus Hodgkinia cicadicola]|uniref:Cytochrome c oxidase subunit 3 n=1 Tax=Candidatus Hodgkinia cicadicola TaxID=573658 RepID=A0ABX4MFE3_9HYPH|nr:Cytochrome c oxidase subunit 3 [Candidatus Hodgkinia cicadicola]PIM95326.1 Cytochrome c oxidase subunit 3 [Candidatus Hodgkinia cicadicola]
MLIMLITSMLVLWSYINNLRNKRYNIRFVSTKGKRISNFNNTEYTVFKTLLVKLMHFVMKKNFKSHIVIVLVIVMIQMMELKWAFNQYLVFYDQFEVLVLILMFINTIAGLLILFIRNNVVNKISLRYWQILGFIWDMYYIFLAKY